ncbi:MAG: hypothetical protein E4H00_08815 [Myxococcales bacterium]|nr:MAG: hypothetical protein E4H00_08815 [Myxococcales bacterium]
MLATALVLGGATSSFAQFNCPVTYAINNGATVEALQFEVAIEPPAVALGDFVKGESVPSGIVDFSTAGNTLEVGWASDSGPVTPTDFAICRFAGTAAPAATALDSIAVLDCTSNSNPVTPCGTTPTFSVSVGTCSECGNGLLEEGEECEIDDPRCNPDCTLEGTCSSAPLLGCISGEVGKSKLQFKDKAGNFVDNAKDAGQYALGKGAATTLADFGADPAETAGLNYKLCVYDATGLVGDYEVASQGTCDGKPCWKGGTKKYQYKSKSATADGVAQISLTPGAAGKTKVQVKMKSKAGTFVAPPMPLSEPGVTAQFVAPSGVCFGTVFPSPAKKNDATQYNHKGP